MPPKFIAVSANRIQKSLNPAYAWRTDMLFYLMISLLCLPLAIAVVDRVRL